jgi:flagellar biosynthesis protein
MSNQYFNMRKRKSLNGPSAAVLKYENDAPKVVAHGTGLVAQKIIQAAKQNHIHLQEDSTLIENLLQVDLGDSVPPQLYEVIAEVFLLLEKIDGALD